VRALLFEHRCHEVRHRPHALADLRAPGEAAGEADSDVVVFIRLEPRSRLHVALADHRPELHRRVDLVAGAVEEAGVDERQPVAHRVDHRREIDAGPPLLVHDSDLDAVAGEAEQILGAVEQPVGERRLLRPVHLRLDDVDRAGRDCWRARRSRRGERRAR
jgi:hypothetical protein